MICLLIILINQQQAILEYDNHKHYKFFNKAKLKFLLFYSILINMYEVIDGTKKQPTVDSE